MMQRAPLGNGGPFIGHRVEVTHTDRLFTDVGILLAYTSMSTWDSDSEVDRVYPALLLLKDDNSLLTVPVRCVNDVYISVIADELLP